MKCQSLAHSGADLESRVDAAGSSIFKILAGSTRLEIINALLSVGETSVVDLARRVGMSSPAVCHHLQVLQDADLVSATREGRTVKYRVKGEEITRRLQASLAPLNLGAGINATPNRPIRIGSTLPLSGFAAEEGRQEQRSLVLAVDEWNAKGGVGGAPIELVVLDAGNMAQQQMLANFESLLHHYRVDAILNGYLFCTGEEMELVARSGTPYLHHNTSSLNRRQYANHPHKYWMCFQCDSPEILYAHGFWRFIRFLRSSNYFEPKSHEIAIISSTDTYATIISEELKALAPAARWRVIYSERRDGSKDNWSSTLRALHYYNPEIVYFCNVSLDDNISFVKAFRENPTNSIVYGQYSPTLPDYAEELGEYAEGTITSTVGGYLPDERGSQYRTAFEQRWGTPPGRGSGGVLYDQVNMYLTAVAVAGGPDDRRAVCRVLDSLWPRGASGVLGFGKDRTVRSFPTETVDPSMGVPLLFMQVQKGEQRVLYPPPYVEAEYRPGPWMVR